AVRKSARDGLVAPLTRRDNATARRLSSVLDALLHLDGEVRRHAEPRFLVEATLARLAVELGTEAVPEVAPVIEREVPTAVPQPAVSSAPVAGWSEVLEKLNR